MNVSTNIPKKPSVLEVVGAHVEIANVSPKAKGLITPAKVKESAVTIRQAAPFSMNAKPKR